MRNTVLLLAALFLTPALVRAQPPAKIDKVRVGFRPYNENFNFGRYKVGLWVPVYVEITAGQNGLGGGGPWPYLKIETPDFEGVGTIYRTPVVLEPNENRVFLAYTKAGNTSGDIKVELHVGSRTIHAPPERPMAMDLHGYVYLALGRRVADLPDALRRKDEKDQNNAQFQDESQQRVTLFEDNADLSPRHWFGYDGVDMIFLSADNKEFLVKLADQGHVEQLRALVQWVRRGGRLVIPMSKQTQELVANLLGKGVWQPPVPVVPPAQTAEKFPQPNRLQAVEEWGDIVNIPLPNPGDKAPLIAQLDPPGVGLSDWEVQARAGPDGPPLITRVRYGLGQIVYFAFSLDDPAFSQWPARQDFLRKAIAKLAPRGGQDSTQQQGNRFRRGQDTSDVTSQIFNALDNFDVHVIPFGVVALFIVLYVIVVGPLEFVLLKYLFGRLEWTWITFPAVVIGVSVIAYFSAYALKGQDLKINKVDVVDFDLRTDLDGQRQPRAVRVYGQSYLMILSPRIQSYTLGIEPNPPFWGDTQPAKPLSADLVSWMARPDPDDFAGMGRSGNQGFFRKPYYYGDQHTFDDPTLPPTETLPSGVSGVPIPVWMSKAFSAAWETTATVPPVVADLAYHRLPVNGKDIKITGTLRSNLAVDLVDAWLIYADHCYPIEQGVPAKRDGGEPLKLSLEKQQARVMREWFGLGDGSGRPTTSQGPYNPTGLVKQMLFHEQFDTTRNLANHSLRRLDLSWRLYDEPAPGQVDRRTREAILVARVNFRNGPTQALTIDSDQPLPTRIWLGRLPESGDKEAPELKGTLNQDTFVRVILPVKPAGN